MTNLGREEGITLSGPCRRNRSNWLEYPLGSRKVGDVQGRA